MIKNLIDVHNENFNDLFDICSYRGLLYSEKNLQMLIKVLAKASLNRNELIKDLSAVKPNICRYELWTSEKGKGSLLSTPNTII